MIRKGTPIIFEYKGQAIEGPVIEVKETTVLVYTGDDVVELNKEGLTIG